ncbi:hypothetical protein [Yersinia enterocolitica]|uniref:hypothetical protein n=1 Tax=Yersinia enterocolitica TaxID=630 RepID=UPI00398D1C1C
MNNIEEIIGRLKTRVALAELIGPDEMIVSASDLSALIAQLEAAQKELKKTQEESDIPALRSEAANIIGLLTAEGHQTFTLDKVADFFDDIFRKFEAAEAELSAANEKLNKPVVLPKGYSVRAGHPINEGERHVLIPKEGGRWLSRFDVEHAIRVAGFTIEGE